MVDLVRFELPQWIRRAGFPECHAVAALPMMMLALQIRSGHPSPDALLVYRDQIILVEVGRYVLSKWPLKRPVLHIGFDRRTSMINGQDTDFEDAVVAGLEALLPGLPPTDEEVRRAMLLVLE